MADRIDAVTPRGEHESGAETAQSGGASGNGPGMDRTRPGRQHGNWLRVHPIRRPKTARQLVDGLGVLGIV